MTKIALDSSAIPEILFNRPKTRLCLSIIKNNIGDVCINILVIHHAFYFGLKEGMSIEKFDSIISVYKITSSSKED